jgi:alpha-amylase
MHCLKPLFIVLFFIGLFNQVTAQTNFISNHPAWIMQGNIYEVNVRQYTPEGTFKAFEKHLQRIKNMGVQTLWFMPINPISVKDRKGSLGSYYAISNYKAINPEYGTMDDWKHLVNKAHLMGFKVIIDWVPNHTGADHYWLQTHPGFYVKDSIGNPVIPFGWVDTRQLDYTNMEMQDSMIASMKYWLKNSNIDGFRCDVAWNVPGSFWKRCISELKDTKKDIFMLAEGDKSYLHPSGFDATYPWDMFHMMLKVAKGERPAFALDSVKKMYDTLYPSNALEMYFTSNHDENSWNKADYETMPGPVHAPFAIFTQTMYHSVPLIYGGQEEPFLRAISFFEKDTIVFKKYQRAAFYKKLLLLRKYDPALNSFSAFKKIKTTNDDNVYAYVRYSGKHFVFVLLNLSDKKQTVKLKEKLPDNFGKTTMLFDVMKGGKSKNTFSSSFNLAPWGYVVLMDDDASIEAKAVLSK